MHHYPFHPGDYMLDTAHLEPMHDLCYRRALDLYYASEAPLAFDKQTLSKRLRVSEQTLSEVLAEFFDETADGWRHSRCDREIDKYQAKSASAKKAGSLGGKKKKASSQANAKRTLSERQASATNQNQEPELEPYSERESTRAREAERIAGLYCRKDNPLEVMREILHDLETTTAAEMARLVERCQLHIDVAPGASANRYVPTAKRFFGERQWRSPESFEQRWKPDGPPPRPADKSDVKASNMRIL